MYMLNAQCSMSSLCQHLNIQIREPNKAVNLYKEIIEMNISRDSNAKKKKKRNRNESNEMKNRI